MALGGFGTEEKISETAQRLKEVAALQFILAGNAVVTFRNQDTGKRFTYKIRTPKEIREGQEEVHFVSVLRGPDNNSDYGYIGCIFARKTFRWTKRATVSPDSVAFRTFEFVFARLTEILPLPVSIEIYHEGRCGRCGRRLTVPESVITGFGPECVGRM